ncbi:two-component regulator propeller domain-containing protein, partial [Desulfonatronum sp. SC1]|uniref:two-component regulator propeller domain-containing protein n=1 Tax=Desulfonatronum sp. SC1 TaxID=2109626 RepID=UPI000D4D1EA2
MTSYFKGNGADGLLSDEINALTIDMHGRIWIGSTGGVNYYDPKTGKIVAVELNNGKQVFNEQVLSLSCDQTGRLLIGTRAGLNVLSFGDDTITSIEPIFGLSNEMIASVMTDDKRRVWVSSSRGISMLSVDGVVRSFDNTDG